MDDSCREDGDGVHEGLELSSVLANLPELLLARAADPERWAIIVDLGSNRFAQALATEEGALVVECVSNRYLSSEEQLSPDREAALVEAGFSPPTGFGEPHPNFFAEPSGPGAALDAARMMAVALTTVLGGASGDPCGLVIRPLASAA